VIHYDKLHIMGLFYSSESTESDSKQILLLKLKDMLQNLEKETGEKYQLSIRQFGKPVGDVLMVGQFSERSDKLKVTMTNQKYKELELTYGDYKSLENKIKELQSKNLFEETKLWTNAEGEKFTIGKCRLCHSYNDESLVGYPNLIDNKCQTRKCPGIASKWQNVDVVDWHGVIRCELQEIGRYEFV